jgi:CHAT domain-containing protein/tetratricopeptide (TPR) repeat protein
MWLGRRSRYPIWANILVPVLLILWGPSSSAQDLSDDSKPISLATDGQSGFTLAPGATRPLQIAVKNGEALPIIFEQISGIIAVTSSLPVSPPNEPRTNPAGMHSKIVFRLIGKDAETVSFSIQNPSKTKPASVLVSAGIRHVINDEDRKEADAETSFAHAEAIRSKRDPSMADEALSAYDHAIEMWREAGDKAGLARGQAWKAMFLGFSQNDLVRAQPLAHEATQLAGGLDTVEAANSWKIAGYINAGLANYDSAEASYDKALLLFEKTGDQLNQEILLDNKAKLARQLGRSDEALTSAKRAASIAGDIGDLQRQLSIEEELGSIYTERGELKAAYDAYEQALGLLKSTSYGSVEGYVWSDLGVLYTQVHDFDHARDALDQASAYWQKHPNLPGQINTLDDYGELFLELNQPDRARTYLTEGLNLAQAHSLLRQQVFLLRGIGNSYLHDGDLDRSQDALAKALEIAKQVGQGDEFADVYCSLGDLNARRKDWIKAKESYEACRRAAIAAKSQYDNIRAEGGLAQIAYQTTDLEDALQHADVAIGAIESVRGHLSEQDLKTAFFSSMHAYYDLDILISMRLDKLHPGEGYAWKAFLVAERARSRLLLDQMMAAGSPPSAGASPAWIEQHAEITRELLLAEQTRALLGKSVSSQKAELLSAKIVRLTRSEHELHQLISSAGGSNEIAASPPSSLSLASIQGKLLDRHTVLLEYWLGEQSSFLWVITQAGVHHYDLPRTAALAHRAAPFSEDIYRSARPDLSVRAEERDAYTNRMQQKLNHEAEALGAALLPPRSLPPRSRRILVVQDAASVSVPFAALRYSAADGSASLAQRFVIVSEPSVATLTDLFEHARQPRPWKIAIFSNPVSTSTDARVKVRVQDASLRSSAPRSEANLFLGIGFPEALPQLRFADQEASSIVSVYGRSNTVVMSGFDATVDSFKALDWGSYTVGHFATHAILNQHRAELSGLVLSVEDAGGTARSGMLWYGDISRLHAPLELVVLSACETASGERVPGEGLLGLSHAFMAAGSQRVLGTLWKVDDEATAAWMRWFYLDLKQSKSPAEALHQAQVQMAADPRWHSPYYWAGFTLEGNWHAIP